MLRLLTIVGLPLLAELCAPWLLADDNKVCPDRAKRLRIAAGAAALIKHLSRSLAVSDAASTHCGTG